MDGIKILHQFVGGLSSIHWSAFIQPFQLAQDFNHPQYDLATLHTRHVEVKKGVLVTCNLPPEWKELYEKGMHFCMRVHGHLTSDCFRWLSILSVPLKTPNSQNLVRLLAQGGMAFHI